MELTDARNSAACLAEQFNLSMAEQDKIIEYLLDGGLYSNARVKARYNLLDDLKGPCDV